VGLVFLWIGLSMIVAACGSSRVDDAKRAKQAMMIRNLIDASKMHLLLTGKLPDSLEDLQKPIKTKTQDYPEGLVEGSLLDVWGNPLVYEKSDDRTFRIVSLGADGKQGGDGPDADISSDALPPPGGIPR
jgi:general secretion pathway protein G